METAPVKTPKAESLEWYKAEQAKGLIDIKFYPGNDALSSEEGFFATINTINRAVAAGQCRQTLKEELL